MVASVDCFQILILIQVRKGMIPLIIQTHSHLPLSPLRLCCNMGNDGKCHAELVSASNLINTLLDPEINSGWQKKNCDTVLLGRGAILQWNVIILNAFVLITNQKIRGLRLGVGYKAFKKVRRWIAYVISAAFTIESNHRSATIASVTDCAPIVFRPRWGESRKNWPL